MIRHCNGEDPNLQKEKVTDTGGLEYVPCDCGKTFDDVYHLTIYPHESF